MSLSAPVASKPRSKRSKERIKSSTAAIYASVFALLISVVAVGYKAPQEVGSVATASRSVANSSIMVSGPSASDVTAAAVAATVASAADLAIAGNVNEFAASVQIQSQYSSVDEGSAITKPTIVELSEASRNIATYAVEEGDTLQSIAAKFNISVNTIKWANDLIGDTVAVGKVLDILPRSGVVYVVKSGDSIESIADKYKASASAITTFNDLEISGLKTGLKIIIPDGVLPEAERPGYVSPVPSAPVYTGFVTGYGAWHGKVLSQRWVATPYNLIGGYADGNCTAYAYMRRAQIGRPVPTNLGNAYTWATQARVMGYNVNKTPAAGAVIQAGNHVGVVEEVLPNGDLRITDMNYGYRLNNLAERIIPASSTGSYMYIH